MGFLGQNGAGKTTTIKSLLNLINYDSGEILFFNNKKLDKEKVGIVLDNYFFYDFFTPDEILKIIKPLYKNWDMEKYENYINLFNIPKNKKLYSY